MQIGFYGDSFCEDNEAGTYIRLLQEHYKTNITKLGQGGGSHWDIIINQFLPEVNNLPDVCIFTWPDENRMFHRTVRHIRLKEALDYSKSPKQNPSYSWGKHTKIWKAAEQFYYNLYDEEKNLLEYKSALHYFDSVILPKYNKKFIHLWSFGKAHDWQSGEQVNEGLLSIAERFIVDYHGENRTLNMESWNHMPGEELNTYVFNLIKDLIDK